MKNALAASAFVSLALALSPASAVATPCNGADMPPTGSQDPVATAALVCLVNGERARHGLRQLKVSASLKTAASRYAGRLVDERFYSHVDPAGGTVERRVRASGYLTGAWAWGLGENLAWGSGSRSTPDATLAAWLASPAHRTNLLMPDWREIGIGQAAGNPWGNLGATWAAEFGERIAKPKPAKRKHRKPKRRSHR